LNKKWALVGIAKLNIHPVNWDWAETAQIKQVLLTWAWARLKVLFKKWAIAWQTVIRRAKCAMA